MDEYKQLFLEAGFTGMDSILLRSDLNVQIWISDVLFVETKGNLNAYSQCDSGSNSCCSTTRLPKQLDFDINKWAGKTWAISYFFNF